VASVVGAIVISTITWCLCRRKTIKIEDGMRKISMKVKNSFHSQN
jgi:hypothetical protein